MISCLQHCVCCVRVCACDCAPIVDAAPLPALFAYLTLRVLLFAPNHSCAGHAEEIEVLPLRCCMCPLQLITNHKQHLKKYQQALGCFEGYVGQLLSLRVVAWTRT